MSCLAHQSVTFSAAAVSLTVNKTFSRLNKVSAVVIGKCFIYSNITPRFGLVVYTCGEYVAMCVL